jgi:serine/threonine-protein kinase
MSRVFVALEPKLGRHVVVKVLPPDMAPALNVDRFQREIQLAASLQHPLIVPLLTAESTGDLLYYVMPYIEGDTLRTRLAGGALPVSDTVRILRDVADALAYAHRQGIVHRDIKPENVLLAQGHALVTDFGVAKALSRSTGTGPMTTVGVALGTPTYMAPEQAAGDPDIDARCDLYALGVIGYEMLTGHPPFTGFTPQSVLAAQLTEDPVPVTMHRSEIPPALAHAVMRCLEKEPQNRWASATELVGVLEGISTPSSGTAPIASGRRRSRRWWPVALAVFAVLAVAGWLGWRVSARSSVPVSTSRVAVLPFTVHGSGDLAYLGDGMVNLLGTSLDGAGDLHTVDARTLLGTLARSGAKPLDPTSGAAMAARLGAGLFVLGDIVKVGDSLHIDASLYNGDAAVARGSVEGVSEQLFGLVDRLATQLLANRSASPGTRVTQIAAVTTSSLPALKAYLEGEHEFRAGHFEQAADAFQRAVTADSMFALAYYRLSIANEWLVHSDAARLAAEQAVRHANRLSDHDRQLLQALLAGRHGDPIDAERRYRAIVGTYPDDLEAWIQLGEVQFHYGPLLGRGSAPSREAFGRVLELDPENVAAVIHLARIAAMEANRVELDSLVVLMTRLNPAGDRLLEVEVIRAFATGDSADRERVLARLNRESDVLTPQSVLSGVLYPKDKTHEERLIRVLLNPQRSAEAQALGHELLAYRAVSRGRWHDAVAELAVVDSFDRAGAIEHGALFGVLPFLPTPRADLEQWRARLLRWNAAAVQPAATATGYYATNNGTHAHLRLYLLGAVNARLGDDAAALAAARELERLPGVPFAKAIAIDLAHGVRGQVAWRHGRSAEALSELEQAHMRAGYEPGVASPFFSEAVERFLRAAALDATGRREDALQLYGSFKDYSLYDLIYLAPASLARGRILDQLGRRTEAVNEYTTFIDLWRDCDPELRPLVREARLALSRLGSQAGR